MFVGVALGIAYLFHRIPYSERDEEGRSGVPPEPRDAGVDEPVPASAPGVPYSGPLGTPGSPGTAREAPGTNPSQPAIAPGGSPVRPAQAPSQAPVTPVRAASPKISTVAPDWVNKGAHIKIGGIELGVRPAGNGRIVFKPIFGGEKPKELQQAIKAAEEALSDPKFVRSLLSAVRRGTEFLKNLTDPKARARSGETNYLAKDLEKLENKLQHVPPRNNR